MQIVSLGDNLHTLVFREQYEKYFKVSSAEFFPSMLSISDPK